MLRGNRITAAAATPISSAGPPMGGEADATGCELGDRDRGRPGSSQMRLIAALCALGGLAHLAPDLLTRVLTARSLLIDAGGAAFASSAGQHGWFFTVMALVCLICAAHLVWSRSQRALAMTVVMEAVMLSAHLAYLLAVAPSFSPDGRAAGHSHLNPGDPVVTSGVPAAATHESHASPGPYLLLPVGAELVVLVVGVPALRRERLAAHRP
ncbi:hypothetical protein [Kineosporia babensis]|uniref:Uncharacterized protein n=1 Tax=Kineosporia babensis TaxID=499548 RepID=A0A9X1NIW4_9ACTN|nr:hypothetical protein [Kineosporia babensis]MCD5315857.1 hypothetical protein [Kineosporia babensis]